MPARRVLELLVVFAVACGEAPDEYLGRASSPLNATPRADELGIDDAILRRVDSQPFVVCPPDTPFVCRSENAVGWACSEAACAPSCEKIGCPGGMECKNCGSGAECAPPDHDCGR